MKKILTGDEQLKDTFVCTLIKLFGIEKYDIMEKFCNELEISFSIIDDRKIKPNEYFEFLNEIKSNLMEECRNSSDGDTGMNIEINPNPDEMDMDVSKKEMFTNVTKLLEEAYSVEPAESEEFINPVFNSNFYIIFFLILVINNQMDSARYLYKRLPKPILSNRTIVFLKVFLSFMLKKDVGKALSVLNKEIEVEIKKLNVSIENEEDYIEEDIVDKNENENEMNIISQKGKNEEKNQEDNDEKMDIYPYEKSNEIVVESSKEKMNHLAVIENNTPEHSSETTMNAGPVLQVDTPEETMKDVRDNNDDNDNEEEEEDDDNDNEEEEEEDDDDDDDDDDDYNDVDSNDESNNNNKNENISKTMLKITENMAKINDNTMTPTDIETPLSYTSIGENNHNNIHITKSYFKIKRCSLFIKELLLCLLENTRKRQINLIAKAYDHILVKEVAKTLDYPEDKIISYITENYGWDVEPAQDQSGEMMFIPKREVKERKQEMSINHIDTLINHLIFLEDSDKIQTIERF
ncbi:hypothetical protein BCR32DRAFT_244995 [Anaeromyces robustus]|uniref:CSN8/PSMD8/EIF3K domain-containing protein n=1 Tax=Anaeromyces robustus TaxID=1754192 RepID=A0A1Y1X647_9FUNG|nr:hypothetical protein BCR32DRAFT_244995 [Anaeromyces robustus]|eukprot:ORX81267.1 hypothetical protein BCR32DRAFT_244995 [Anaeromyces robustus]